MVINEICMLICMVVSEMYGSDSIWKYIVGLMMDLI